MGAILSYNEVLQTYKTRGHRIRHLEEYKHLFPIKRSVGLAGIIADLIGDGNLQKSPQWRIDFTSKNLEELKRFEGEMFKIFGIRGKIRSCQSNLYGKSYNMAFNCAPVARILYLLGVPAGQKVLQQFDIPDWIKNDKNCFARFSQRLFTCEGYVMDEPQRKTPQVRINMWKWEKILDQGKFFFDEISRLMKIYFSVESKVSVHNRENIRKDGLITRSLALYIHGQSVLKFHTEIGFEGLKQEKLSQILASKKV